jgi:hypothetical protein
MAKGSYVKMETASNGSHVFTGKKQLLESA